MMIRQSPLSMTWEWKERERLWTDMMDSQERNIIALREELEAAKKVIAKLDEHIKFLMKRTSATIRSRNRLVVEQEEEVKDLIDASNSLADKLEHALLLAVYYIEDDTWYGAVVQTIKNRYGIDCMAMYKNRSKTP